MLAGCKRWFKWISGVQLFDSRTWRIFFDVLNPLFEPSPNGSIIYWMDNSQLSIQIYYFLQDKLSVPYK